MCFLSLHRYFCACTLSSRACSLYLSAGCPVFCIGVHFTLALCIDVSAHLIPVPRCWQCPLCLCIDVYVLVSSQGTLCPRCIDVCISSQGTLCPRSLHRCLHLISVVSVSSRWCQAYSPLAAGGVVHDSLVQQVAANSNKSGRQSPPDSLLQSSGQPQPLTLSVTFIRYRSVSTHSPCLQ